MTGRVFVNCLNQEQKIYNIPIFGIISSVFMLVLVGIINGLMWGMGGGAAGFVLGVWLSKEWYRGNLQRQLYWRLPGQKLFIDKNIPESHHRKLM